MVFNFKEHYLEHALPLVVHVLYLVQIIGMYHNIP